MAYRTQSLDTSEEFERVQFAHLRGFGPGRRLQMMQALSRGNLRLAWGGLKRTNPHLSERELQIKAVRLWYGDELAARLEAALQERNAKEQHGT